jgi:hypothetical protein
MPITNRAMRLDIPHNAGRGFRGAQVDRGVAGSARIFYV